ncbi:DNA ligase [Pseudocercospora fuligena]|uniref:DNA ligase n=1 Tax=Pseudocercospora fuligena TaxID=685502 RepID=A0A8H6VKK3_9PEZI|nr:DNA ligase [Pseudocercospora fuligena]
MSHLSMSSMPLMAAHDFDQFSSAPSTIPSPQVYVLERYEEGEMYDEDGEHQTVGIYSSLDAAIQAARNLGQDEASQYDFDCDVDEDISRPGHYHLSYAFDSDDDYSISFNVFPKALQGSLDVHHDAVVYRPHAQKQFPASSYGPMITIPQGRRLLRGAHFMFTGTLHSMTRDSAIAAIDVYGGQMAVETSGVDYAVIGHAPHPDKLRAVAQLGLEVVDESKFHKLLIDGVPPNKVLQHERLREVNSQASSPLTLPPLSEINACFYGPKRGC